MVTAEAIYRARAVVGSVARVTPVLESWTLAERSGGTRVVLKAENLQRTGSFKLRGAVAKLAALGDDAQRGVPKAKTRRTHFHPLEIEGSAFE